MYLHELEKGSKIKVDEGFITFDHVDGMYSYCTCDWVKKGEHNVIHLSAMTPLVNKGRYYVIDARDGK